MRKTVPLLVSMALALLFASGVGLLTALRPAEATFPGQNGKIAYVSYDVLAPEATTDREIYTIDPTGGTPFQLTNNNTLDDSPSYSPDGKKIAFSHKGLMAIDLEIWTINATGGGTGKVNITNNKTDDRYPDYSPNGNKIAYTGFDGTDEEIYAISVGGGTAFKVTNNDTDDGDPSWGSR
jgi:Tol biopolymer transport system component